MKIINLLMQELQFLFANKTNQIFLLVNTLTNKGPKKMMKEKAK